MVSSIILCLDQAKLSRKQEAKGKILKNASKACDYIIQCMKFFQATHYNMHVSAIELGATEYAVMMESTYLRRPLSD